MPEAAAPIRRCPSAGGLNLNPLDLLLGHLLIAVVVDAGCVYGGVPDDVLGRFQVAVVLDRDYPFAHMVPKVMIWQTFSRLYFSIT